MSGTAKRETLEELHQATTEQLLLIVSKGIPVRDKDGVPVRDLDGGLVYEPAAPAYFAQAVKLLKDNDVTVMKAPPKSPLGLLAEQLSGVDVGEDDHPFSH